MTRLWGLLLLAFLLYSCDNFETKKIDAVTLYEEEMADMNWEEVDKYPLFNGCDETRAKDYQRQCFHGQVSLRISNVLRDSVQGVIEAVNDTVYMQIKIDTTGAFSLENIKMDSLTRVHLPKLESWFRSALPGIKGVDPATKKGVPVATIYTLPVILTTN